MRLCPTDLWARDRQRQFRRHDVNTVEDLVIKPHASAVVRCAATSAYRFDILLEISPQVTADLPRIRRPWAKTRRCSFREAYQLR
jgi:hypothetical protein